MNRRFALYLGGLVGPFGTIVTIPMIPELRDEFGVGTTAAGLNFTAYLVPMAALLVVSGTMGERFGRARTLRVSAAFYALASILCLAAPTFAWFLIGRALQGLANAFFTPLVVASLAEETPPHLLGRVLGIYGSFQAVGTAAGPLVGGLAADTEWRWAFGVIALFALYVAAFVPPGSKTQVEPPSLRPLFTAPVNLLGAGFFAGAIGPLGAGVLVGLAARDELGLDGRTAGFILLLAGAGAAFTSPSIGRLMDRVGGRRGIVIGLVWAGLGNLILAMVFDVSGVVLAIAWTTTWVVANLSVLSFHAIGAGAIENNRGGGLSLMLSYRFAGMGLSQLAWLPVFTRSPELAFAGAGSVAVLAIAASWASGLDTPKTKERP